MSRAPVLLAIDTATSTCSVALATADRVDQLERDVGQRHSEHLLSMIDEVLAVRSTSLGECDAIAFGAGPGSFTGLRIACGVAQGLAYGIDRPVIPIGSLAAVALDVLARYPGLRTILVAQDARMGEVYWAVYRSATDRVAPIELVAPALAAPEDLVPLAMEHAVDAIAGTAIQAFGERLRGYAGRRIDQVQGGAAAIARLALEAFAAGAAVDAALAAPLYVRDRVALTVEERRVPGSSLAAPRIEATR